jgi:hypothetical protein
MVRVGFIILLKEENNIKIIKINVIQDIYKLFLDIDSKINLQARELKYMKLYCYCLVMVWNFVS